MTKRIIVSAADDSYFSLLIDLISSIEDSKGETDIAIGVLDVGLTSEQRDILSGRVQHMVTPIGLSVFNIELTTAEISSDDSASALAAAFSRL